MGRETHAASEAGTTRHVSNAVELRPTLLDLLMRRCGRGRYGFSAADLIGENTAFLEHEASDGTAFLSDALFSSESLEGSEHAAMQVVRSCIGLLHRRAQCLE